MRWFAVLAVVLAVLVWPGGRDWRRSTAGVSWSSSWLQRSAVTRLWGLTRRRRGRDPGGPLGEVAACAAALVPSLEAGLTPAQALAITSESLDSSPVLRNALSQLREAALLGEPLGPQWLRLTGPAASRKQLRQLSFIARSWDLSEALGAPLAPAVATGAAVLREQDQAQRRLTAAAAGPRASMWLLTLLPLVGPLVGFVFGMSPVELYAGSMAAAASLTLGVLLELLGWGWSRRLLQRAMVPEEIE